MSNTAEMKVRQPKVPAKVPTKNDLFLSACKRLEVPRTPVWFMRQAGRYLPEYRAVRAKADFLTLCKTPELAAEVTVQPVDIIGVDAAIIFSDILVLPEAMGMELIVEENKGGPRFPKPLHSGEDIHRLRIPDPSNELRFVLEAIRLTRKILDNRVPLIGFSGSPWTLAAYMIEGKGSKEFTRARQLLSSSPRDMHVLLQKLARSAIAYLRAQIEAGAQAVQIFDTWGGVLEPEQFREFSLRYIAQVTNGLSNTDVPIIVFCKDCGYALEDLAASGAAVVGLDWKLDIGEARKKIGRSVALQGNLDPAVLLDSAERIELGVKTVLEKFGKGNGHIFNLGHGVLPDTPVEHAKFFVDAVKRLSPQYH